VIVESWCSRLAGLAATRIHTGSNAILRDVEQRLEVNRIAHSKPSAPAVKEFAMALEQNHACEPQRSIKLFVG
jgi:hypothetical protein